MCAPSRKILGHVRALYCVGITIQAVVLVVDLFTAVVKAMAINSVRELPASSVVRHKVLTERTEATKEQSIEKEK